MIPASFDYLRAGSVAEAIGMLSDNGDDAKLLAGGHSLLPLMKFRLATPAVLVDIGRLRELSYVRDEGGHVAIGALTRHHDIATSPEARAGVPVLAHVAGQVGDPQVRHRGTIGGSIAHGDSASDLPAVVLALGGSLIVEGPSGRREIAAHEFHLSFFEVSLEPDEILVEVRVPRAPGDRWGFEKLTKQRPGLGDRRRRGHPERGWRRGRSHQHGTGAVASGGGRVCGRIGCRRRRGGTVGRGGHGARGRLQRIGGVPPTRGTGAGAPGSRARGRLIDSARIGPMVDHSGSLRQFLKTVVRPAIYGRRAPLDVSAHHLHGEPIPALEAVGRSFSPFNVGDTWGGMWDTTWFRFRGSIPDSWAGAEVVALIHLGGDQLVGFTAEGQIWDTGLRPLQGLHHEHREFVLTREAHGDDPVEFFVEAAANPIPPWHMADWPLLLPDYAGAPLYTLETAELAVVDRSVEGLFLDMRVLVELAAVDPDRSGEILLALEKARGVVDPENVAASVLSVRDVLAPFLDRPTSSANTVVAVGHAHIDSAWLWPLRETRRKCARTFSNQLRLLERYPEHHFVCSQAVQYQWMKDGYPELYEQIREQVRAQRWEPVGGMWVEPDTNVPSGESLVRQLVYGKRFFGEEFGIETHELWIPDVFGYSAALPQIAREAGVTSLITQKMSWNDTNPFPHTSFWWEGHDGSRLLAHFPPANTYNGDFSAGEVAAGQDRVRGPHGTALNLYPFGYGDGGGGPNHTMVERFRRMTDLHGLPRTEIGTVASFLDRLGHEADDLPVWVGELYLEAHRATLTTHAEVKLANRRAEEALRAAELWSVAASLDRRPDLDRAWKLLLLHQFHDILPGSSIHWVYEDTRVRRPRCSPSLARSLPRPRLPSPGEATPGAWWRSTRRPPTGPTWSNWPTARWPWCRYQGAAGRRCRLTSRSAAESR